MDASGVKVVQVTSYVRWLTIAAKTDRERDKIATIWKYKQTASGRRGGTGGLQARSRGRINLAKARIQINQRAGRAPSDLFVVQ